MTLEIFNMILLLLAFLQRVLKSQFPFTKILLIFSFKKSIFTSACHNLSLANFTSVNSQFFR